MKDSELLALEYNRLYDEIQSNSQITATVFTVTMTATATLIGFGLDRGVWGVFLAPFALIIPSLYFLASQMASTTKNAAYIAEVLEPAMQPVHWEADWHAFRLHRRKMSRFRFTYTGSISGLYGLVSVACIALAWLYAFTTATQHPWELHLLGTLSAIILLFTIHASRTLIYALSSEYTEDCREVFREVKEQREKSPESVDRSNLQQTQQTDHPKPSDKPKPSHKSETR